MKTFVIKRNVNKTFIRIFLHIWHAFIACIQFFSLMKKKSVANSYLVENWKCIFHSRLRFFFGHLLAILVLKIRYVCSVSLIWFALVFLLNAFVISVLRVCLRAKTPSCSMVFQTNTCVRNVSNLCARMQ